MYFLRNKKGIAAQWIAVPAVGPRLFKLQLQKRALERKYGEGSVLKMKIYEIIANELVKKPEERSFHFKQIEGWLKKIGYIILPLRLGTLKGIGFALNEHHHLGERVLEVIISEKEVDMLGDCELLFYMQMEMHDLFLEWNKFMQTKWGEEEVPEMTKDDLKTGMVVETRDGSKYMVVLGECPVFMRKDDYNPMEYYNQDLTSKNHSSFTICKVYNPEVGSLASTLDRANIVTLIWKRKSTREVCLEQKIERLKAKLKDAEVELEKECSK